LILHLCETAESKRIGFKKRKIYQFHIFSFFGTVFVQINFQNESILFVGIKIISFV